MIETNSPFIIRIKKIAKELKAFIMLLILICVVISLTYFLYYIAVKSDDYIIELTGKYLTPMAQFLNPDETSYIIYRNTSIYFLCFIIPLAALSYVVDVIEGALFNIHKKIMTLKENAQTKKEYKESLKEYIDIKDYSICISLECEQKKQLENQMKKSLAAQIKKTMPELKVDSDKTIVITSSDFEKYDENFDYILKILSGFKKQTLKKYELELVFSITTDAHLEGTLNIEEIQDNHFKILNFNFKNRACCSALFSKKYKFLDKEKYSGIPVGLFDSATQENKKYYELNIVFKNLNQTLSNV